MPFLHQAAHAGMGPACLAASLFSSLLCFGPYSRGLLFLALYVSLHSPSDFLLFSHPFPSLSPSPFPSLPSLPSFLSASLTLLPFPHDALSPPGSRIHLPSFLPPLPTTSFFLPTPRPPGNWRETGHYPAEVSPPTTIPLWASSPT